MASPDVLTKRRFESGKLHGNSKAVLRHFSPTELDSGIQRDRFGNRVIVASYTLAYFDRDGNETKAALLASPQGEGFIKANSGILVEIDRGLRKLSDNLDSEPSAEGGEGVGLRNGWILSRLTHGAQSDIYILEAEKEMYVIKAKTGYPPPWADVSQPYINEMLQSQAVAVDLAADLEKARVSMPHFMFASGQLLCRRFEEGEVVEDATQVHELIPTELREQVRSYVRARQIAGEDLWNNIRPDFGRRNVVKRDDVTAIWIDPFYYDDGIWS